MGKKTKVKKMNFADQLQLDQAPEATPAQFILSLLQVRDQAQINHWQTTLEAEHRNFGMFYEDFLELIDTMVESILGKYGTEVLAFDEAMIGLVSYNGDHSKFIAMIDDSINLFCLVFDKDQDSELYNELDNIKMLRNKLNYLLSQK
jgi:hypothetical protein